MSDNPRVTFAVWKMIVCLAMPGVVAIIAASTFGWVYPKGNASEQIDYVTAAIATLGLGYAALAVWMQHEELKAAMVELKETKDALESQAATMQHQSDLSLTTALIQSKQMLADMYSKVLPTSGAVRNTHIPSYLAELRELNSHERWAKKKENHEPAYQLAFYIREVEGIHNAIAGSTKDVLQRVDAHRHKVSDVSSDTGSSESDEADSNSPSPS